MQPWIATNVAAMVDGCMVLALGQFGGSSMSGFACRAALSLAAIGLSLPAGAQQKAPQKIVWNAGWEGSHCTLTTGTGSLGLSLWLLPGDTEPELYIGGVPQLLPPQSAKAVTVTLLPGGQTFSGEVFMRPQGYQQPVIPVRDLGEDFLAAFSKSETLQLVTHKGSVSIPIKGASKAVPALKECNDVKMEEWGLDAKAFAALRTQPEPIKKAFIRPEDYPVAALDRNEVGSVIARLKIDPKGKVTECTVLVSSRSQALDRTTCALVLQRHRYTPAIGADDRPTTAQHVIEVSWWLSN